MSPAAAIPLVGSMASTSSRGPSSCRTIKPEIGAPGASVSAQVGTGDGETAFGGTSGAAPMVSGAVALMLQAFPHRSPTQIKAMLMNSANTTVYTNPALLPGGLAPDHSHRRGRTARRQGARIERDRLESGIGIRSAGLRRGRMCRSTAWSWSRRSGSKTSATHGELTACRAASATRMTLASGAVTVMAS